MAETIDPPRNFRLSLEDRIRAYAGPPAYMRRRRAIEDLEESLLARTVERLRSGKDAVDVQTMRDLARLNDLVDRHNRYYPTEANLPMQPLTGRLLERGVPWTPLEAWTIDRLVLLATKQL